MSQLSLGDAIKDYLTQSKLKNGVQALQLTDVWEQIMGKTIARYTDKIEIVQKTLFIRTQIGPLRSELMYQKEKILERVNEQMGAGTIETIVVR